jgi:tetratricopeptide (TPR) repeat protein
MSHLHEENLILYAIDPEACLQRPRLDAHLQDCMECQEALTTIRQQLDRPQPVRTAPLERALKAEQRLEQEEQHAEPALRSMIRGESAGTELDEVLRTAGGIRLLIRELPALRRERPAHALELANRALELSESITEDRYPPGTLGRFRGMLWTEQATTLRVLGRFREAMAALELAEELLVEAPGTDFDLAGVWYVRAAVLREMDLLHEALLWVRDAVDVYERYGDARKLNRAEYLYGAILYRQARVAQAQECWANLLPRVAADGDQQTVALLHSALGQCAVDLNDPAAAEAHLHRAIEFYETLGLPIEILRARWVLARGLIATGRLEQGIATLREIQRAFRTHSLRDEVGLVGLDIADVLLALEKSEEAAAACTEILDLLRAGGSTPNILRAVEYLREATSSGRASRGLIREVRGFLEVAPRRPNREFQPTISLS